MMPGRHAFRNRYEYGEPYDSDSMDDDEDEDPDMEDDDEEDDEDDDDSEDSEDDSMEDGIPSHSKHSSVVIEELDNDDLEVIIDAT